ncbi:MAG: ATP-dependent zinc metalloprotease FtsH [Cytophagales bacterium]|jgi:cell division protease FtsH|nr:ATP-dependent zinc metalloprotease FtsH [Cytophagales bacterium]
MKSFKNRILIVLLILFSPIIFYVFFLRYGNSLVNIDQKKFEHIILQGDAKKITLVTNQNTVEVSLTDEAFRKEEYLKDFSHTNFINKSEPQYALKVPSAEIFNINFRDLQNMMPEGKKIYYDSTEHINISDNLWNWVSLIFMLLLLSSFFIKPGAGGRGILGVGQSNAKIFDKNNKIGMKFSDVAGLHEAKEEVKELVDFLRDPIKYTRLGAKIPHGLLLVGRPGTGKTLLAKAIAGEAGVAFFSLAGSDFVEMFVGVGASRVRDLFKKAKEKSPAIIFIDELDAIGRTRKKNNYYGTNEEHENTLNSLLVEMDGFENNTGIIIIGATNRVEVLDQALLRPGRFDRQVSIDNPDIKDRREILDLYIKKIEIAEDISLDKLAEQTPGFSGAELANVCNEAALLAGRHNKTKVEFVDFQEAMDRVIGGLEKKNKIISEKEKKIVAYHEAGHTLVSWFLKNAQPFLKVTIIPRGIAALGYAQYLPKEQYIIPKIQLFEDMCVSLGGRISEELNFKSQSTGAMSDLKSVTQTAYSIVAHYGMNKNVGLVSFYSDEESFQKPYSEQTASIIDGEVRLLIKKAYTQARNILVAKRDLLTKLAEELFKKEVLFKDDVEMILGVKCANSLE